MRVASAYLLVLLLPVLYNVIPSPRLVRWYLANPRSATIPSDVMVQIEQSAINSAFVGQAILLVLVIFIVRRSGLAVADIGLSTRHWVGELLSGCGAGLVCVALYGFAALFVPSTSGVAHRWELRTPFWKWTTLSVSSAVVEELWRVSSLTLLREPQAIAVAVTAIAFGCGHAQSRLRIIVVSLLGVYLALVFFQSGSAWTLFAAHLVINIGVFVLLKALSLRDERRDDGPTSR
jgi:hypothetical protein